MKTLFLLCTMLIAPALTRAATPPDYAVTASIAGPDGGGWDYARVDPAAHRLYVARAASVTVIDTRSATAIGAIGTIAHGHAVLPLAGGRLLVTSGEDASVRFLSAEDGAELGRVAVGAKPDAAILSDDGRTAFVMNADAGTISAIDVASMRQTRTIAVKPALEYAALAADGTLFVNDEDANEMEVVDTRKGIVAKPIAMPACQAPSGLAFDAKTGRLLSACANGKLAIIDARARRTVGYIEIGRGPDAVILDAERRLAFVPCGKDGVLDILTLDGPTVRRAARVRTAIGARTGALDPATGAIYLPTAAMLPPRTPGARPTPIPGSFRVLVVRPSSSRG